MEIKELAELILVKLEQLDAKVNDLNITSAKQEVTLSNQSKSLDEHIKRTNLLEMAMQKVNRHVHWAEGIIKFMGVISLVGSVALLFIKLWSS